MLDPQKQAEFDQIMAAKIAEEEEGKPRQFGEKFFWTVLSAQFDSQLRAIHGKEIGGRHIIRLFLENLLPDSCSPEVQLAFLRAFRKSLDQCEGIEGFEYCLAKQEAELVDDSVERTKEVA